MNLGYHFDLIREAMLAMAEEKGSAQFSSDAVDLALLGNSYNDIFQVDETRMLVNDAFFRLAKIVVENTHYDRLPSRWHNEAYTRQLVQNTLKVAETACAKNDPAMLLIGLGMSMHIIQDFYSHSNWAELETYRFFKPKKDPTLFDSMAYELANPTTSPNQLTPLTQAIAENCSHAIIRFSMDKQIRLSYGLYTHGTKKSALQPPGHDLLRKDYAGQPGFEWGYRSAFKASLELILMVRQHVQKLPKGTSFWAGLASYKLPTSVAGGVHTLVSFEEGTIRWMCTYGGAWKWVKRWSNMDIVSDDLPEVGGIETTFGIEEQYTLPPLGMKWLCVAVEIVDRLFQVNRLAGSYLENEIAAFSKEQFHLSLRNLLLSINETQWKASSSLASIAGLVIENSDLFSPFDIADTLTTLAQTYIPLTYNDVAGLGSAPSVATAFRSLDCPFVQRYDLNAHWVRVQVPFVDDLDTGGGYWDANVNNEEIGGKSDYWVKFDLDGLVYTEAENVDKNHTATYWQVFKPCLSDKAIKVNITLYESDPSDHTDEKMDILPGSGRVVSFVIQSISGAVSQLNEGIETLAVPQGTYMRSRGSGDLRAMVRIIAGKMSDQRVECSLRLVDGASKRIGIDFKNTLAIVGGYAWRLGRPDHSFVEYDHFSFDPGNKFKAEMIASFRLALGNSIQEAVESVETMAAMTQLMGSNIPSVQASQQLEAYEERKRELLDARVNWGYARSGEVELGSADFSLQNKNKVDPVGSVIQMGCGIEPWITAAQSEEALRELSVVVFTGQDSAGASEAPVTISFFNDPDSETTRLGHFRLSHFEDQLFKPGCADFFWLSDQKLDGFTSENSYKGKIKRIRRVKILNESEKTLAFDRVEIYANGHLIAQKKVKHRLAGKKSELVFKVDYPKLVRFTHPPEVKCKGIFDIPYGAGRKGIKYAVTGTLEMLGYDKPPQVTVVTTPGGLTVSDNVAVAINSAEITTSIYINRHINNIFNYTWKAKVVADNKVEEVIAVLDIPRPEAEISEDSFSGGDELVIQNGKKTLHFTGSYHFSFDHFGTDKRSLIAAEHALDPNYDNQKDMGNLWFSLPERRNPQLPFRDRYQLHLKVNDRYDISLVEVSKEIALPVLDVAVLVRFRGELYRYYVSSRGISKISASDPNFGKYAQQFDGKRSDFSLVDIYLIPYLSRDKKIYSFQVFEPTFKWTVPKYVSACNLPAFNTGGQTDPVQIQSQMLTMADNDVTFQSLDLNKKLTLDGPRIAVRMQGVMGEVGIPIRCLVKDAVGQQKEVNVVVSTHMGASLADLHREWANKMWKAAILRYSELGQIREIVQNDFRIPVWEMDPDEWRKLSPLEKEVLQEVNEIAQVYAKNPTALLNSNRNLQKQLSARLESLGNGLAELGISLDQDLLERALTR